jgi:hypothetical protein
LVAAKVRITVTSGGIVVFCIRVKEERQAQPVPQRIVEFDPIAFLAATNPVQGISHQQGTI